jgi:NADPH2:quinone reductase
MAAASVEPSGTTTPFGWSYREIRARLPVGQAAVIVAYGRDQQDAISNCLQLQPQEPPPVDEVTEDDIVVAVRAAEIVWTDTVMATGQYQHRATVPYSPGMTYAGVVAWCAPAVTRRTGLALGDRVAVAGHDAGPRSLGRYQRYGGCASYALAPVSAVRRVPDAWSFAEAACFAYGYDTAYHCLVEAGHVRPGETILIHGASGGVGIPAVRMARLLGLTVVACTRSSKKEAFLRGLGAHHVIALDQCPEGRFAAAVKALTEGRGVDVVYDGVGGDEITIESMRALRFGGRLLIVGWAATPAVGKAGGERGTAKPNLIPTNLIMMKSLEIKGCPAMIAARQDPSIVPRRVRAITEWIMSGALAPPTVGATYPLAEIREAFLARVLSGGAVGSTLVLPPELPLHDVLALRSAKL